MDVKRIEKIAALDSKISDLLTDKALLHDEIQRLNRQIEHMTEERHKIIKFDSWMHHYSETVLIQKMDLFDEMARMYYGFMDYYKTTGVPKSSRRYQFAKTKYRTAMVNLESIIDKINWIDSKFYRKEF